MLSANLGTKPSLAFRLLRFIDSNGGVCSSLSAAVSMLYGCLLVYVVVGIDFGAIDIQ